jgi:hypothetical protein
MYLWVSAAVDGVRVATKIVEDVYAHRKPRQEAPAHEEIYEIRN